MTAGATASVLALPHSSVYPSGAAFETKVAPSDPPTPGLFSMMTGCPRCVLSTLPTRRALRSVGPPVENGTTSVTARAG